ncbi:hypothetical protein FOA43_000413 [Brettanomyces nanus]|uniref:Uncharacterized protein n=1 Tax=Eeniella nana TaxID=13502 RepID=A0A875RX12_EENNA|nr:uncharacterized protein FOA43_000413 [Brettanomyces nanus]QPG73108.1 hypothetical protein FOA43_000413 [Brettanomyces nanus]
MTIYIASLFLPYTIHFEVEASKVPMLNDDEIVEPVESLNSNNATRIGSPSEESDYEDSTISILKSLAKNKSTSNLSYEESELASISSGEASEQPSFRQQLQQQLQQPQQQQQPIMFTPSNRVSVQDFFFNNPNSSRLSLSSPSIEDTQARSEGGYFAAATNTTAESPASGSAIATTPSKINTVPAVGSVGSGGSGASTSSPTGAVQRSKSGIPPSGLAGSSASAYVRPHSRLRNPPPPTNVSELLPRPSLEHTRSTRSFGSSMSRALLARRASSQVIPRQRSSLAGADVGFEGDGDSAAMMKPLSGQRADDQLDRYFAEKTTNGKVVPFGGFSRDYKSLLNEQNNVFATAPWKVVHYERGNGSLRNAVHQAVESGHLKDVQWIGTPCMPSDLVPQKTRDAISVKLNAEYASDPIYVSDDVFEGAYDRFCKQVLWPILHYQLPEQQKANEFLNGSWRDYETVNRQFADKLIAKYKEGDIIWIHDYHLMLVPAYVRKALPKAKIGFFLHVSFPSSEVFRCLAQRKQILEGLLGADCVGMQADEYVAHFFQSCNRLLLADFDDYGIHYGNRTISVTHNPIGIDAFGLQKVINGDVVNNWRVLVRDRWAGKMLIVSRDKMDKIRGVKEKLLAYERFLNENPEYLEKTLLLLICIPGRAAADEKMENEILTVVDRINSRRDNIASDRPVIVLNQDLQFEQYLALLSEAGLFIVSTLREGMNLTCHEFVEASSEDHSPLILSEFVGSAAVLSGGALITNPYNVRQVAEAIRISVEMSAEEKGRRWKAMHEAVLRHDSLNWVIQDLKDIDEASLLNTSQQPGDMKQLTWAAVDNALLKSNSMSHTDSGSTYSRLFIIDLGVLISNVEVHGTKINPIQQRLTDSIINNLASDPSNAVYLLSSSTKADLGMRCRSMNDVGILSENGAYVRLCNELEFTSLVSHKELEWLSAVVDTMKSFSLRIPGAYVETESSMVRFHTEGSHDIEPEHRDKLVGELMAHINELYGHDWNLHAHVVNKMVVVQEADTVQKALSYIVDQSQLTFVMATGETSPTNEEVYNFFRERRERFANNVLTVKMGKAHDSSNAEFKLHGMNELLIALSRVA